MISRREVTEPQGLFHPGRAYSYASIAYMLHTIEKMEALPAWLSARELPFVVTEPQLTQALIWLALLVLAILLVGRTVNNRALQVAVASVVGFLLATVVGQVSLSLATWSYMPGTGTAVAILLPAALWLYRHMALGDPARLIGAGVGVLLMAPITWGLVVLATLT
ncbi:MAG: HXXEE domain-containing protein [Pseudomonadota bacterium]|nr:HXXEE domain-containing protein [Pseudomonadota bacterium]